MFAYVAYKCPVPNFAYIKVMYPVKSTIYRGVIILMNFHGGPFIVPYAYKSHRQQLSLQMSGDYPLSLPNFLLLFVLNLFIYLFLAFSPKGIVQSSNDCLCR